MKKSRFSEDQIIGFSKEAEAGMPVALLAALHRQNIDSEHNRAGNCL
jgi:hypothetical protein